MKKPRNYVDNEKLLNCLKEYKDECKIADIEGSEKPPIPEYVGQCILSIANKMANRSNFNGYSFRDEMISDGIENVLMYALDNFDPDKYDNAFGYFSRIIWFAFLRRIEKEEKLQYIKIKNFEDSMLMDEFVQENGRYYNEITDAFIEQYESKQKRKKERSEKNKLKKEKSSENVE